MSEEKKDEKPMSEEDVALSVSEDKRLIRLGIDPDGDPREIMNKIEEKQRQLEERSNGK